MKPRHKHRNIKRVMSAQPIADTPAITVKTNILTASLNALLELYNTPLRASVSAQVKRIAKKALEVNTDTETKRLALCEELGTMNEGESEYKFSDENLEIFRERGKEILETDVVITERRISMFDLQDAPVSAATLDRLDWLIQE